MKKWLPYPLVFCVLLLLGIWYMKSQETVPSMTYFPENETNRFNTAYTNLNLVSLKDSSYQISWKTKSITDEQAYLRQDFTFLFANGELRGAHSSWKQHAKTMQFGQGMPPAREEALWQSISLHHAEMHDAPESITGIQHSTSDKLYVRIDATEKHAFHEAKDEIEREIQQDLDKLTKQRLMKKWSVLAQHYHLRLNDYIVLGLTDLQKYEKTSLPGMTQKQTNEVIGKLWEGIYKNYLLPAVKYKKNGLTSYMPCILLDRKNNKIIVLFDLNGKPYKLIQQIPTEKE